MSDIIQSSREKSPIQRNFATTVSRGTPYLEWLQTEQKYCIVNKSTLDLHS